MEVSLDSHDIERAAMGTDCARIAGQGGGSRYHGARQSAVCRGGVVDCADRRAWRDLPQHFGKWYSVYTRFWRWANKGVWKRVFKALSDDPDFEYVLLDATLVRVHQHGTGAKGGLKIRPSASRAAA